MRQPYPFNDRGDVASIQTSPIMQTFNRLAAGVQLSREEKNNLFHELQGNSGKSNYMLAGVVIPFGQFMKRFFVKYSYGDIREILAFDKTCIRSSYYTNHCISEIIEIPKKQD